MSEKKFTVNPGDEIIIRVPSRSSNQSSSLAAAPPPSPKKAIIQTLAFDDSSPRRLSPGGVLNFYDLGLIKNEDGNEFVDLDFVISKPTASDETLNITLPTEEDFQGLQERLFETAVPEWKNTFYKITETDAENYDLGLKLNDDSETTALDETNEQWTPDGLKLNKSVSRLRFSYLSAFFAFDTGSDSTIKITAEPDYESSPVSMSLSKEVNVFLVPTLAYQDIEISKSPKTHILNKNWLVFPRARFKAIDFFKHTFSAFPPVTDYETINDWFEFLKTQPAARHLSIVSFSPPPGTTVQIESLDDLPEASADPFLGIAASIQASGSNQAYAGKLVAVIETSSKIFYLWAKGALGGSKSFVMSKTI